MRTTALYIMNNANKAIILRGQYITLGNADSARCGHPKRTPIPEFPHYSALKGRNVTARGGSAAKPRVRKNSKDKHPEGGQQHSYNGWENQDYGQYYRLE